MAPCWNATTALWSSRLNVYKPHCGDPMTAKRREPSPSLSAWDSRSRPEAGLLTRLARKIHEVGLRYTLSIGIRRLIPATLFRFTRMTILEILPHDATAPVAGHLSPRWAVLEDLPLLKGFGHTGEVLQARLDAGARCCLLTEGTELLSYVWFHAPFHDEEDLGVRFALNPGEIWLFDAMVKSDQRGRGLYQQLLRVAVHDLGRVGVHRVLIAVDSTNRNSLRAHQSAGADSISMIWGLRIFGVAFVYCRGRLQAGWTGATGSLQLSISRIARSARRRPTG